jgi:transcriptional regulator with XRE-family HTH domain
VVRARRRELGLTKKRVAELTGVDRTTISALERDGNGPLEVALLIVDVLGLDTELDHERSSTPKAERTRPRPSRRVSCRRTRTSVRRSASYARSAAWEYRSARIRGRHTPTYPTYTDLRVPDRARRRIGANTPR